MNILRFIIYKTFLFIWKKSKYLLFAFFILILLSLSIFYSFNVQSQPSAILNQDRYSKDALESISGMDLKKRISELLTVKASVKDELLAMEDRRSHLHKEISEYSRKVEILKNEIRGHQQSIDRLNLAIEQAKITKLEAMESNYPDIKAPLPLLPNELDKVVHKFPKSASSNCGMGNCFDYSRCSITSQFPFYVYSEDEVPYQNNCESSKSMAMESLQKNLHLTYNPKIACVYIVILCHNLRDHKFSKDSFKKLPYWNGDGRNHILLNLKSGELFSLNLHHIDVGRAMILQSDFHRESYRHEFDIVIPPFSFTPSVALRDLSALSPAKREYFMSYVTKSSLENERWRYNDVDIEILSQLNSLMAKKGSDRFHFDFNCDAVDDFEWSSTDWPLCHDSIKRTTLLKKSTFSLIILPSNRSVISSSNVITRLLESIVQGTIPVIVGEDIRSLPLSECIAWRKAVLLIPKSRVTEIHFILQSLIDADILTMKRQGRYLWQAYFNNAENNLKAILACLRSRIGIPALPAITEPSPNLYHNYNHSRVSPNVQNEDSSEILGPIESPFSSPNYQRNYSQMYLSDYDIWNKYFDPFYLYPSLPHDPVLFNEAKFTGSSYGFRPIGEGKGGAGKEFNQAIGGNYKREQFTIVMLTYDRQVVLMESLQKYNNLPNLNKIVVVWNNPEHPSPHLVWPEIHVPIHVIKAKKNSLNNRFLPFDAIETDAVLSVDDDVRLRHDEITFAFRVWRESRNRIVGFPSRYSGWDYEKREWFYHFDYSCELSIILTGAAFFHKYYMYQYSHFMPQAIKDKVDEYKNCEDIAFNFLVSHMTRLPPLKVTSKWTFKCPGCPNGLSHDRQHMLERHKCMQFFVEVYGYMPLLNTQFRVDSVLFKTRIPQEKQKCFKYV